MTRRRAPWSAVAERARDEILPEAQRVHGEFLALTRLLGGLTDDRDAYEATQDVLKTVAGPATKTL
jgi:hypothetical protein